MLRLAVLLLVALTTFAFAQGLVGFGSGSGEPLEWGGRVHQSPGQLGAWLEARGGSYEHWALRHPEPAARLEGRDGAPRVTLHLPGVSGETEAAVGEAAAKAALALAVFGLVAFLLTRRREIGVRVRRVSVAAGRRAHVLGVGGVRLLRAAARASVAAGRAAAGATARFAVWGRPRARATARATGLLGRRSLVRVDRAARAAGCRARATAHATGLLGRRSLVRVDRAARAAGYRAARAAQTELGAKWAARPRRRKTSHAASPEAPSRVAAAAVPVPLAAPPVEATVAPSFEPAAPPPVAERGALAATAPVDDAAPPLAEAAAEAPLAPAEAPHAAPPFEHPVAPSFPPPAPPPAPELRAVPSAAPDLDREPPRVAAEAMAEADAEAAVPVAADVERCEIRVWHGYVKSQFYAVNGGEGALASSPLFKRAGEVPAQSPPVLAAHAELVALLVENGWVPDGQGDAWYAQRFSAAASAYR